MTSMSCLKAALYYQKQGFSVIPVNADKKPIIKWEEFQKRIASPEEIKSWFKKTPSVNIGIVTGEISNLTVIDIDTKEGRVALEDILPESFLSPIADTPSGGSHFYCRYEAGTGNAVRFIEGCDIRSEGGYVVAPPSSNGNGKAWAWREGVKISEIEIPSTPLSITNLLNSSIYKGGNATTSQTVTSVTSGHKYFQEGRRDEDLFTVANALAKGRLDDRFIEQTLGLIAKNLGSDFTEKVINDKVRSAIKRVERIERNISEEARQWVLAQPGHFRSQDGHKDLTLLTSSHKHAFNVALNRMCEGNNPVLKRYGKQRGAYTRLENDIEEIDWRASKGEELPFKWIMGFEEYIKTMPKTIYVIAGDPDAGKSALCLNLAIQNCGAMPISYFSSEMGADELGQRIREYDGLDEDYIGEHVKFFERDEGFDDVIKPNHINIIDYYEISKDFWEIAESLKNIRHNLDKGIAIVAVQKKRGSTLGRGAEFGLEKPRLYMRVEPFVRKDGSYDGNIITIEKAKNWRDPKVNPNKLVMKYKLVKGINLIPEYSCWRPEIDEKYSEFK